MADRYGKADKVKDLFEGRFDKVEAKLDHLLDISKEGFKERDGREETTTKYDYETDGDGDGDADKGDADKDKDNDKRYNFKHCTNCACASYKSDYDSGDAEDDKDKTVRRVNRVRYDDRYDDTDDGDDVQSSDSELNDEDLAGWGFTTDEDD